jgi:hypothetical protein
VPVNVRIEPVLLSALDRYIKSERRPLSRPEAIRELLADSLIGLGLLKSETE